MQMINPNLNSLIKSEIMNNKRYHSPLSLALRTLSIFAVAVICCVSNRASGGTTLINFDNIPDFGTKVDTLGTMFPGITLSSQSNWIATYVNATDFIRISNRCLADYGTAPLSILFASPSQDITMDIGSGYRYESQTASITGYLGNQLVFSENFVTQPDPSGAEEVHVQLSGTVDRLVLYSISGGFAIMMDNLSFSQIPEPSMIQLLAFAGILILFKRSR